MTLDKAIKDHLIKAGAGPTGMTDKIIEDFGERCKRSIRRQFTEERQPFNLRMSGIGKPLCQQTLAQEGATPEPFDARFKITMLLGDMVENIMMAVLEDMGVQIDSYHEKVSYDLGPTTIKGEIDVVIDGKVYDIKSSSDHGFKNKFDSKEGFHAVLADDPFGYVLQGYLYAASKGLPFGGWIVVNKNTGHTVVCEAPVNGEIYLRKALKEAAYNADYLINAKPFKRCYDAEPETYYKRPTGDKTLNVTCGYCAFKKPCWGDKLEFRANNKGKGKTWKWFVNQ